MARDRPLSSRTTNRRKEAAAADAVSVQLGHLVLPDLMANLDMTALPETPAKTARQRHHQLNPANSTADARTARQRQPARQAAPAPRDCPASKELQERHLTGALEDHLDPQAQREKPAQAANQETQANQANLALFAPSPENPVQWVPPEPPDLADRPEALANLAKPEVPELQDLKATSAKQEARASPEHLDSPARKETRDMEDLAITVHHRERLPATRLDAIHLPTRHNLPFPVVTSLRDLHASSLLALGLLVFASRSTSPGSPLSVP